MGTTARNTKWIEAISVLIELTQQGELKWRANTPPRGLINSGFSGSSTMGDAISYVTQYEDKWFKLRKNGSGGTAGSPFGASLSGILGNQYALDIVDDTGNLLYSVPETTGLSDLYQAVQYQLSGVDKVLTSLLSKRNKRI